MFPALLKIEISLFPGLHFVAPWACLPPLGRLIYFALSELNIYTFHQIIIAPGWGEGFPSSHYFGSICYIIFQGLTLLMTDFGKELLM
jgi:hypothetical protein